MSLERIRRRVLGIAGSGFLALFQLLASPAHAEGPFATLNGAWTGGGTIILGNGSKERIRCRGTYAVRPDGNSLQQSLRCASDSYNFDLSADVSYSSGYITGQWSERTKGTGGTVSGTASATTISALVQGNAFSATLTINTRGASQSVTINPRGMDVKGVSISLRKG